VDFGGSAGDAALLESSDLRGDGFDTHRAPLRLTMEYLERELGCKCLVLAIQPKDVRQRAPICDEVRSSCENITRMIMEFTLSPVPLSARGEGVRG
jgi:Ni,Fe-hydrogenase maturation factor